MSLNPQVIFLTNDRVFDIKSLYYSVLAKPILIISDDSDKDIYVMINLTSLTDNKLSFSLNKINIENQKLKILPKLLVLGGTELDARNLYLLKEEELKKEKEIVQQQELKLVSQQEQIAEQLTSINEQNKLIEKRKKSIDSLFIQIDKQTEVLETKNKNVAKLQEEIAYQQVLLRQKIAVLNAQKDSIVAQKSEIDDQKKLMEDNYDKLAVLNEEIAQREKDIEKQKSDLTNLEGTVESQQKFMWLMGLIILLVVFIVFYVYRNFKLKKKLSDELSIRNDQIETQSEELLAINQEISMQKDELQTQNEHIEEQNLLITDSIKYANRIQSALLPALENIEDYFESFIIYRPKDIVSGDFYWYHKTPATEKSGAKVFVAVVDCTGHGVPGALLSMIGSRLLSEIVTEMEITSPAKILEILNKKFIETLQQKTDSLSDGMDISLCKIEKNEKEIIVTYTGASRPLFIYQNSTQSIIRIRGSRISIGGYLRKYSAESFKNNEYIIQKGDAIYLSSDGMVDQNNTKRKRFGTPRLKSIMKKVGKEKTSTQKQIFVQELDNWQGNEPQRDDITLMGIKF